MGANGIMIGAGLDGVATLTIVFEIVGMMNDWMVTFKLWPSRPSRRPLAIIAATSRATASLTTKIRPLTCTLPTVTVSAMSFSVTPGINAARRVENDSWSKFSIAPATITVKFTTAL